MNITNVKSFCNSLTSFLRQNLLHPLNARIGCIALSALSCLAAAFCLCSRYFSRERKIGSASNGQKSHAHQAAMDLIGSTNPYPQSTDGNTTTVPASSIQKSTSLPNQAVIKPLTAQDLVKFVSYASDYTGNAERVSKILKNDDLKDIETFLTQLNQGIAKILSGEIKYDDNFFEISRFKKHIIKVAIRGNCSCEKIKPDYPLNFHFLFKDDLRLWFYDLGDLCAGYLLANLSDKLWGHRQCGREPRNFILYLKGIEDEIKTVGFVSDVVYNTEDELLPPNHKDLVIHGFDGEHRKDYVLDSQGIRPFPSTK